MRPKTVVETSKTILLMGLIISSLILSWMLWNSQPDYEYIHPSKYVEQQPFGTEKKIVDLVKPTDIIFHYGQQLHTRALPNLVQFGYVLREIEKWYFYNLETTEMTGEQWLHLLNDNKGIEIIYPDEIPVSIIEQRFALRGGIKSQLDTVNKIWIYENQENAVTEALFISEQEKKIVRAQTAISLNELENLLSLGNVLSVQTAVQLHDGDSLVDQLQPFVHVFYMPQEPVEMRQFRYFYQPITESQMVRLLFVDPGATRRIMERDGTVIYTDGSRGVQVPSHRKSMTYHDPRLEPVNTINETDTDQLAAAVDFVNRNGGWTGNYILEQMDTSDQDGGTVLYRFRQYEGSHPVYSKDDKEMGEIKLKAQGSFITEFKRPLFQIDRFINYETKTMIAGTEVWNRLPDLDIQPQDVRDISPGYRMELGNDYLDLIPVWVIKTRSDTIFYDGIEVHHPADILQQQIDSGDTKHPEQFQQSAEEGQ